MQSHLLEMGFYGWLQIKKRPNNVGLIL